MGLRGPLPGSGPLTREILVALARGPLTTMQLHAKLSMSLPKLRAILWRMTHIQNVLELVPDPTHQGQVAYRIKERAAIDSQPQYRHPEPPDRAAADRATRNLSDAFAHIVAVRTATP